MAWLTDNEDGTLSKEKFIQYKNIVYLAFLVYIALNYLINASRKAIFTSMSESLTLSVRNDLMRAIFHK